MSRLRILVAACALALAGCAGAPTTPTTSPVDDPAGDRRLQETLQISDRGPAKWPAAATVPLAPVLFVADTTIKFVDASVEFVAGAVAWIQSLLGGGAPPPPVPERVKRAADSDK